MITRNPRPACLLLALFIAPLSQWANASSPEDPAQKPFVYDYDESFPLPSSRQVRITSEDAELEVSGSDRTDVRIRAHYSITSSPKMLQNFVYRLDVHHDGPDLRVEEMRKPGTRKFVYDKQAQVIKVDVPRNAHIKIEEEDGKCIVAMIAGSVDVKMDDGHLEANDCSGAIKVAFDNGTITQRNCTGAVSIQRR